MKHSEIKKIFIETVSLQLYNKLSHLQKLTIDEAIDHIIDGTAKINGRTPETIIEILTVILHHFEFSDKVLQKIAKELFESNPEVDTVNLTYRGETFTYKGEDLIDRLS